MVVLFMPMVHFACGHFSKLFEMFCDFQPDRVMEFCKNNDLQLIVRAHECVMDGFERFAQGHLITLFSATNYCGMKALTLHILLTLWCGVITYMQHSISPGSVVVKVFD